MMALYKNNYNLQRFFTPREKAPGTPWTRGWVDPRTGLHVVEKRNIFPLPEIQPRLSSP
jgi:hypothetical protein